MINPKALLQMKSMLTKFRDRHPKVPMFFSAAANAIDEGSVLEVTLTTSTGKTLWTLCTNLRVTAEDLQSVRELRQQLGN